MSILINGVLPIVFTSAKMMDDQNFLQAGCPLQPRSPVAKILNFAFVRLFTFTLPTVALAVLSAPRLSAQMPNCAASYEPGVKQQRVSSGLFDGRVGTIKVVNNTENATIISLYHPDAPKRVFKYWYAEPGQSYLLGTDGYSSDWGIQVDEGPICLVGRVASWDGRMFTTFPSRLFIADSPPIASPNVGKNQTTRSLVLPTPQRPEAYEAIATKQITQGEARSGLISLLRAADLYRASGQVKEERRVRDRIKQIRDAGKASV